MAGSGPAPLREADLPPLPRSPLLPVLRSHSSWGPHAPAGVRALQLGSARVAHGRVSLFVPPSDHPCFPTGMLTQRLSESSAMRAM